MSSSAPKKTRRFRFSLRYLIVFTTIVAIWASAFLARQKLPALQSHRDNWAGIATYGNSTSVFVENTDCFETCSPDFQPYEVYIPEGEPRELRFFCGDVSEAGLPPAFESFPLSCGHHQIIFWEQDNLKKGYRFRVYVDDVLVINKSMGKEWMPLGWSQSSSFELKRASRSCSKLTAKRYIPIEPARNNFLRRTYRKRNRERFTSSPGYQLCIDEVGRPPQTISNFFEMDFQSDEKTIGFLKGPILLMSPNSSSLDLSFYHPIARDTSLFTLEPEFIVADEDAVIGKTGEPVSWKLSGSADQIEDLKWQDDSANQSRLAFLHATPVIAGKLSPVIELKWTSKRPKDIGLRLPAVPANASITRWRLNCKEGVRHLWQTVESGELLFDISEFDELAATNPETAKAGLTRIAIPLAKPNKGIQSMQCRANVSERFSFKLISANPQIPAKKYRYNGDPFQFGFEFSASAAAKVWAISENKITILNKIPVLGGRVIEQLIVELDATDPSWVWLRFEELKK